SVMVNDCTFLSNHAVLGGAIYAPYLGTSLTVTNSSFVSNFAVLSGGAVFSAGYLTVSDTDFRLNSAQSDTGLIDPIQTPSGGGDGGAVYCTFEGAFSSNNNNFEQNYASGDGGAIYSAARFAPAAWLAPLVSRGDTYSANSANRGGAIVNSGLMTVSGSTFQNNFNVPLTPGTSGAGGAIFNSNLTGAEAVA